jgi:hypothetical protein
MTKMNVPMAVKRLGIHRVEMPWQNTLQPFSKPLRFRRPRLTKSGMTNMTANQVWCQACIEPHAAASPKV